MDLPELKALFEYPPMDARPAPFWFWNDHLEPQRLVEQLDRLLEAGAGGAVMHARGGLPPEEYLDERWFAAIEAVSGAMSIPLAPGRTPGGGGSRRRADGTDLRLAW